MKQKPIDRFIQKVKLQPNGCLEWRGHIRKNGYGMFKTEGQTVYAHRWAYLQVFSCIPAGLELDHLCRNRACVNWQHLEPVTGKENLRRSPLHKATARARGLASKKRIDLPEGVSAKGKKFRARIRINGKQHYLGTFLTPEQASQIYVFAARHSR